MGSLTGKTAVVIGASGASNFGTAIARKFAAEGANVVVAARRQEPLEKLAAEINGLAITCDITDEAKVENLFQTASKTYGRVDIAVNSSGSFTPCPIAELNADLIRPTLEVSFIGAILFFKHAAATMTEGGSVISISSVTSKLPGPGMSPYSGARAGIDYAMRIAAVEYAEQKIRFNSIAAGLIDTDMTEMMFQVPEIIDAYIRETPAGRMGTVSDMAEAALFLSDDNKSGFINGQVIDLAGGLQMGTLPRY